MDEINILIVEDKKENLIFLERTLETKGYKPWSCTNGKEAIKLIKNTPFAAVVTELHMPGLNGLEITKETLKHQPNASVIVITAYSFISSAVEAMEEGAYGYITKPFNTSEVKIVVERGVERYNLLTLHAEKKHFAQLSVKDDITGIYNHRFFRLYITHRFSSIKEGLSSEKFSLLMIDLDFFKKYNDTYGHLAGDDLLRKISQLFQDAVHEKDTTFRYGGEEFVIFLDRADKKDASVVAERIHTLINLYMPVTVSIGISTYPDDAQLPDELVAKADEALYKAKETGRNRTCLA